MGIHHENLDGTTRGHMLEEVALGGHYISPRLTAQGKAVWPELMRQAAEGHSDDWLSQQLTANGYVVSQEPYTRSGVERMRKVNQAHAAQQLAEGEFNRYYIRGLCLRARAEGKDALIVYRGKSVREPRPESQAKIGTAVPLDDLLTALRTNDFVTIEMALGVPGGPNSGLSCKLA